MTLNQLEFALANNKQHGFRILHVPPVAPVASAVLGVPVVAEIAVVPVVPVVAVAAVVIYYLGKYII